MDNRGPAAAIAWSAAHLALIVIGSDVAYGPDIIANVALFYCVAMPVGGAWSLDLAASLAAEPGPHEARFAPPDPAAPPLHHLLQLGDREGPGGPVVGRQAILGP